MSIDSLEDGVEHGEYLYVAVVVDGYLVVRLQMERVNHVDVVQVCRSSFVGDIHRVFERQRPYGEGLELGVPCLHSALVLVVQLGEAYGHLSRTGTRSSDDDKRAFCLYVIVLAETIVAGNEVDVMWITVYKVMVVSLYSLSLQTLAEGICGMLTVVVGYHDAAHHESASLKLSTQAQHILIVCDAEVCAHLVFLYVLSTYHDDNLYLVTDLAEHAQL